MEKVLHDALLFSYLVRRSRQLTRRTISTGSFCFLAISLLSSLRLANQHELAEDWGDGMISQYASTNFSGSPQPPAINRQPPATQEPMGQCVVDRRVEGRYTRQN